MRYYDMTEEERDANAHLDYCPFCLEDVHLQLLFDGVETKCLNCGHDLSSYWEVGNEVVWGPDAA